MKVNFADFEDAFTHADQHIVGLCPAYHKICNHDVRKMLPIKVYTGLISVFWKEYLGFEITCEGSTAWVHFRAEEELSMFLLRWS